MAESPSEGNSEKGNTLQVFVHNTSPVVEYFLKQLVCRIQSNYDINITRFDPADHVNYDEPVMVMISDYSRIEDEVKDATSKLQQNVQKIAVVVVHCKREEDFPKISTLDNTTDQKYHEYGLVVDFGYTEEEGLYRCKANREGINKMNIFLQEHFARYACIKFSKTTKLFLVVAVVTFVLLGAGVTCWCLLQKKLKCLGAVVDKLK